MYLTCTWLVHGLYLIKYTQVQVQETSTNKYKQKSCTWQVQRCILFLPLLSFYFLFVVNAVQSLCGLKGIFTGSSVPSVSLLVWKKNWHLIYGECTKTAAFVFSFCFKRDTQQDTMFFACVVFCSDKLSGWRKQLDPYIKDELIYLEYAVSSCGMCVRACFPLIFYNKILK